MCFFLFLYYPPTPLPFFLVVVDSRESFFLFFLPFVCLKCSASVAARPSARARSTWHAQEVSLSIVAYPRGAASAADALPYTFVRSFERPGTPVRTSSYLCLCVWLANNGELAIHAPTSAFGPPPWCERSWLPRTQWPHSRSIEFIIVLYYSQQFFYYLFSVVINIFFSVIFINKSQLYIL